MERKVNLTEEDVQRYKLRPDEKSQYYDHPIFLERFINSNLVIKLDHLLDKFKIEAEHRNYITWLSASLLFTTDQKELPKKWEQYYNTVDFCQYAIKESPFQMKLGINEKELHLTLNTDLINSLFETLKPWLNDYAGRFPDMPKRGRGRPKGEQNPGKEASLHNLMENLIQIIGMNEKDARELFYEIGLIIGLWQDGGEKRKRSIKYFKSL